jgi:hypothetical protein
MFAAGSTQSEAPSGLLDEEHPAAVAAVAAAAMPTAPIITLRR